MERNVHATTLLALGIVLGSCDSKSVVLFERNVSDAFDFYPKSGAIEIDEAVTLRCNGSSTNGTKRTAAVWLRRTLHDDGDGVDVRRIDDATYYHLTVDSLRIARFDANYVGQYACRRGPDGPIGDWVTLKLRRRRQRACPYLDPPYDLWKTNDTIRIEVDVDCKSSFSFFWIQLRHYGRKDWDNLPETFLKSSSITKNLRPAGMMEYRTAAYVASAIMTSRTRIIETYPNAPSHGPSVISASNVEVNVSKPPSVNLTWDLVDDNEIIGYEVNHKIAGQTTGQDSFLVPGQHPSVLIVFPPEDIGLSHDLVVYASNWGPYRSPPSPPVSIVPATGPGVPQNVNVTAKDSCSVFVSWLESLDAGGLPLTGYNVVIRNNNSQDTTIRNLDAVQQRILIPFSQTDGGVFCSVEVAAINSVGQSGFVSVPVELRDCCTKTETVDLMSTEGMAWVRIGIGAACTLLAILVLGTVIYSVKKALGKKAVLASSRGRSDGLEVQYSRRRRRRRQDEEASDEAADDVDGAERAEIVCVVKRHEPLARIVSFTDKLPFDAPPPYATVIAADKAAVTVTGRGKEQTAV
ncbi:uncharacterized protein [Oscarella lobularis]|uniref:uncharacterized protein isoform X2 n=1 Tax=Oscarella lobularis TaxID=121494 RepID=UPI00331367A8